MELAIGMHSGVYMIQRVALGVNDFWGSWRIRKASGNKGLRYMQRQGSTYLICNELVVVIGKK